LHALAELARNGPAAVAQRQRMRTLFGPAPPPTRAAAPSESAPRQFRVITFDSEQNDPEVDYSASVIAKGQGLTRASYGALGEVRSNEKEVFVGHSAGSTLGGKEASVIGPELLPHMDKTKGYEFVIAACKTGQEAGGFARSLNMFLMGSGMTQSITAPKNALTVVNKDTFLQAEGLDPWKHDAFGNFFEQNWLLVLRDVFARSVGPTIARFQGPVSKADGNEILKSAPGLALTAFFAEDWAKPAVKGFTNAPPTTASKNLYEMGSRLEKLVGAFNGMKDATKLEQRVRKWLAMGFCDPALFLTGMATERERITTLALQNFMAALSPEERGKIKQYKSLGGNLLDDGWYRETLVGVD